MQAIVYESTNVTNQNFTQTKIIYGIYKLHLSI